MSKILVIAEHLGGKLNAATARAVSAAVAVKGETVDVLVLADAPDAIAAEASLIEGVSKVAAPYEQGGGLSFALSTTKDCRSEVSRGFTIPRATKATTGCGGKLARLADADKHRRETTRRRQSIDSSGCAVQRDPRKIQAGGCRAHGFDGDSKFTESGGGLFGTRSGTFGKTCSKESCGVGYGRNGCLVSR